MITKGIFKATGAALNVELGFLPDFVRLHDLTTGAVLEWLKDASIATLEGVIRLEATDSTATVKLLALGYGVKLYEPAGVAATVFRRRAQMSARADFTAPDSLSWTLGNAGNRTGNFSAGLLTGMGVGSVVRFADETTARILALTNDGDAANEVTLDRAPATQAVRDILYAETHTAQAVSNPRNGFTVNWVTGQPIAAINYADKRLLFEAGLYDHSQK